MTWSEIWKFDLKWEKKKLVIWSWSVLYIFFNDSVMLYIVYDSTVFQWLVTVLIEE